MVRGVLNIYNTCISCLGVIHENLFASRLRVYVGGIPALGGFHMSITGYHGLSGTSHSCNRFIALPSRVQFLGYCGIFCLYVIAFVICIGVRICLLFFACCVRVSVSC